MLYPEPESEVERGRKGGNAKAGKGKKGSPSQSEGLEKKPFSDALLSYAREILRYSIDLAQGIKFGNLTCKNIHLHAAGSRYIPSVAAVADVALGMLPAGR